MTMNENALIQTFQNEKFGEVRTFLIDGEPWFVGKDVALALGYKDTKNALKDHVFDEDKTGWQIATPSRGSQNITIISESGLYSLILLSKLPTAKEFKLWVTSEVLPAIRKTGCFFTPETLEKCMSDPDLLIALLTEMKKERGKTKQLEAENTVLKLETKYYKEIHANPATLPVTKIAKDYGMSATAFNRLLHDIGIQYQLSNTWILYQKYADNGYTHSHTFKVDDRKISVHTYWTQAGRKFLYDELKNIGVIPMIERNNND